MKKVLLLTVVILLFGCSTVQPEQVIQTPLSQVQIITPTVEPTITYTPSPTNSPEPTLTPTSTSTQTFTPTNRPTKTPAPIAISHNEIYYNWGHYQSTAPYLVWGASIRDAMSGNCQGFICEGKDLREYDPSVWQFLGQGEYGQKTFTFDQPFDTFVITFDNVIGFDALSGTTIDGETVHYGYLANGDVTASYMDGSNFPILTIIDAENKHVPVQQACGIIDPTSEGDNNFNLSNGSGGIVFNFLDRGFYNSPYATRKGYELISLTVVSAKANTIPEDKICP
jgi:hypothetical protein